MAENVEYRIDVTGNAKQGFNEAKQGADAFKQGLKDVDQTTKITAQDGRVLRKELKDMQMEMFGLRTAGQEGGKTYQFLAQEAGYLKDAQDKARAEVRYYADDFRLLTGGISVMQGLGGAFQTAYGAMNMFGVENKDVLKTMQRFMAVTQVMSGLTQVQNMLRKESAAMLFLEEVRTKTLTVAQRIYAVAVGQSVGAMKALRIALLTTGVGALVVGLGYLVGKIYEWSSATDDQTESEKSLNDKLKEQKQLMEDIAELQEKNKQNRIDVLKLMADYQEAMGNTKRAEELRAEAASYNVTNLAEKEKAAFDKQAEAIKKAAEARDEYNRKMRGHYVTGESGKKYLVSYSEEDKKAAKEAWEQAKMEAKKAGEERAATMREVQKAQITEDIRKTKTTKTSEKPSTATQMLNSAPKTFNIYVDQMGGVYGDVTIATVEDEKGFEQKLIQALTNALTTVSVQVQ